MRLQDPEFWRRLETAINEKMTDCLDAYRKGRVAERDYSKQVGFVTALDFVIDKAQEIIEDMNKVDPADSNFEDAA